MANDKNFKIKNGLLAGRYLQSNGTVASGSEGYYLAGASYDNKSFSVAGQTSLPVGLRFKSDGTKVYVLSTSASDVMYQYSLSTAWDVSTASYDSVSLSVSTQTTSPIGMYFKTDGTSVYVASLSPQTVYQYDLTTAWDLSTASYASKSYNASTQMGTEMRDVLFKPDGTKMYLTSSNNDAVYQYSLSTAWDVSTASYDSKSFSVSSFDSTPQTTDFNDDGTKFYLNGQQYDHVRQFSLSTAYDISTATDDGVTFDFSSQETGSVVGISFGNGGNKLYIVGLTNDTIYQYSTVQTTATLDLSTGNYFSHTLTGSTELLLSNPPASGKAYAAQIEVTGLDTTDGYNLADISYDSVVVNTGAQETNPRFVTFSADGLKMYHGGSTSDDVFQYDLTTAWDLDTASYASKSFDFSSQEGTPHGVTFKPDGTKMFMVGLNNDTVYQYSLSTAWDVSTASYDSVSFSVSTQATAPTGIALKSDGTAFYLTCQDNDAIYQYTMTTAYDLSTTSYASKSKSVSAESSVPRGIVFNSDGTKVYVGCGDSHDINEYALSTAWDISTATYSTVSPTLTSQVLDLRHIFINDNGTKTYVLDGFNDDLHQYTTGTESSATLTWPDSIKWDLGAAAPSPDADSKDMYSLITIDGGTTYYGKGTGENMS